MVLTYKSTEQTSQPVQPEQKGITRITVGNFKSIIGEQSIDIRPLTILAGANSSGKSSIMQPLLLLKQTLEAPYDPGALLLDGPNIKFSEAEQLLARRIDGHQGNTFSVGITQEEKYKVVTFLKKGEGELFEVEKTMHKYVIPEYCIRSDMSPEELNEEVISFFEKFASVGVEIMETVYPKQPENAEGREAVLKVLVTIREKFAERAVELKKQSKKDFFIYRNRCFLDFSLLSEIGIKSSIININPTQKCISDILHQMLHLPGLRGNPQRSYPLIPLGPNFTNFSGTFENYTASVIHFWQKNDSQEILDKLNRDLTRLALTNKVMTRQLTSAHVELLVNRLWHNRDGVEDLVNIADVGFGVSQALPVVVALHIAEPGQLVYAEQPETHLHPQAQVALAEVLADAAREGKRVVIETHSSLLLLGIQTLVAEGKIPPELVRLHWFTQQDDGSTQITSADLDKTGAYGDWPEDFDITALDSESRYIKAAQARLKEQTNNK